MRNYIALIHKEKKTDFGVSFPDFPGCITAGKTIDEAKDMAQEALTGHVAVMLDAGLPLPAPSTLEDIVKNDDYNDAAACFIVSIQPPKKEPVRFNASIDPELLALIDSHAKHIGITRSGFLAQAARKALLEFIKQSEQTLLDISRKTLLEFLQQSEEELQATERAIYQSGSLVEAGYQSGFLTEAAPKELNRKGNRSRQTLSDLFVEATQKELNRKDNRSTQTR